jgi:hypothetical protein
MNAVSAARPRPTPRDSLLTLRRDPFRLLVSAGLWRAVGFLVSYLVVSGVLFSIALTAATVTLVLAITVAALPVLIGTAWVIRGCASFERIRLRQIFADPVDSTYADPQVTGLMRQARMLWTQGNTWRDLAYLIGLWPVLFALDTAVFAVWATFLGGITTPLWYSRVSDFCVAGSCSAQHVPGLMFGYFPHGPHGSGAHGLYVDSIGPALLIAGGCAVLFLLFNYVLVAVVRMHGQVARAVLRHPTDPLAPAREVLAGPGPLGPLLSAADRPDR